MSKIKSIIKNVIQIYKTVKIGIFFRSCFWICFKSFKFIKSRLYTYLVTPYPKWVYHLINLLSILYLADGHFLGDFIVFDFLWDLSIRLWNDPLNLCIEIWTNIWTISLKIWKYIRDLCIKIWTDPLGIHAEVSKVFWDLSFKYWFKFRVWTLKIWTNISIVIIKILVNWKYMFLICWW